MREKFKSILLTHLAGPGNSEDSLGEALSVVRLISKADYAPLDGGPDSQFSRIIGWLETLNAQKGKKNVPLFEQTASARSNSFRLLLFNRTSFPNRYLAE